MAGTRGILFVLFRSRNREPLFIENGTYIICNMSYGDLVNGRLRCNMVLGGNNEKMILDATCGLKQMWFQKDDQETIYLDMRHGAIQYSEKQFKRRPDYKNRIIKPTIQADNRYLPFRKEIFDMVLFDPPHMITNVESSELQYTYSVLNPITWTKDMSSSIKELFRVLKPKGIFVFKWAENSATIKEALKLFPCKPLFGSNPQNPKHKTWWIVFRKD